MKYFFFYVLHSPKNTNCKKQVASQRIFVCFKKGPEVMIYTPTKSPVHVFVYCCENFAKSNIQKLLEKVKKKNAIFCGVGSILTGIERGAT